MIENIGLWILLAVVLIAFITAFIVMQPTLWFKALISGAYIGMFSLLAMRLRRIDTKMVVDQYIKIKKAGLKISVNQIETHILSKGRIERVVQALIMADNASLGLDFNAARKIDLAGRDVLAAVSNNITPKVITSEEISAMAKNGIEVKAKARITLKANLKRYVGTAMEDTIMARVGEGIVTAIGAAANYESILDNPQSISSKIYEIVQKQSGDTAFDVISVDIADLTVGKNILADLQMERAMADTYVAQAEAEERRAKAIASEHEMKALTQEMKAHLVKAESELPKAIAEAFIKGNISVKEYYNLQNVLSDTEMRNAIAGLESPKKKKREE